jgi:hypothetical protein
MADSCRETDDIMKTRNGFVSNSSSSSFVILGVLSSEIKWPDGFDPYNHQKKLSYSYAYSDGTFVIGKRIASMSTSDFEDQDPLSIDDLHRMSNEVIVELNKIAPDNDVYPVKLHFGVSPG